MTADFNYTDVYSINTLNSTIIKMIIVKSLIKFYNSLGSNLSQRATELFILCKLKQHQGKIKINIEK